ncbi:MAG: aminodeoxychorismate synthase, component I [Deltaproteobacteria bacterium]|nr:aminodeoxychorismate synthase, component I [Deltaproteobacteria bacterium]MBU48156.1 aminodeoxychorismate synthase, component I [Deltaproteobacteria bacterium]
MSLLEFILTTHLQPVSLTIRENESLLYDPKRQHWLHFQAPIAIKQAHTPQNLHTLLHDVEHLVENEGYHAAGFVTYEAAKAFDEAFAVHPSTHLPLAWFGLYPPPTPCLPKWPAPSTPSTTWTPSISREHYDHAIQKVKAHIQAGDTYQVNYTFRMRSTLHEDPWHLFARMIQSQGHEHYGAFIHTKEWALCSASPEMFFVRDGETIHSEPMKGTVQRGTTLEDDRAHADWLHHSEKNRAENTMIVDMVRNDLTRIAERGSVHATRLFDIKKYATLWQMTSLVEAKTQASLHEIFRALFPAASITGAPKIRTMELIKDLEPSPRGIYTGAIGMLAPDKQAQFNVAIRTVSVDKTNKQAEYGVGGGIVWDSQDHAEFEECQTKTRVLIQTPRTFSLLETLLWTSGEGYPRLHFHLERLQQSATYFSYPLPLSALTAQLKALPQTFSQNPHKLRLLVAQDGSFHIESTPLPSPQQHPRRIALDTQPLHSDETFLYHKTTQRDLYQQARHRHPKADDVLLYNERGEVTETTIANIAIAQDGQLWTPPVSSGLLPGTYRAYLLDKGTLQERVIRKDELCDGAEIYLMNGVRGLWKATLYKTAL